MVTTITFIHTVLKQLEKYFIRKNNFHLSGKTYDLILLVPSDEFLNDPKYSLIVSAQNLNNFHQRDIIKELLNEFKEVLNFDEYNAISRLNIINSEDPFVKNLKFIFDSRHNGHEAIEINEMSIGGVKIDYAYHLKSLVLEKLVPKTALTLLAKGIDNHLVSINCEISEIDNNYNVFYYNINRVDEIKDEEELNGKSLGDRLETYTSGKRIAKRISLNDIVRIL